ncbi:unnamed protein product [Phytophthora fragariaefolia]|uniref:Unnamed protein product n=1 Tax=Phytophthora fragariaefolia TaxID=1490495 RepID=A0A9W6XLL9_9STRA|nr:unnamed protein product [Phytophthora fragariaefolia]
MADLLLRWLNHELELSVHVTDVAADFASGYLLGEILHRLNHQPNFADFMRSSSADAKIVNFCLLEPALRNLSVKFDANVAAAIMNEKEDAAANLLYQIKVRRDGFGGLLYLPLTHRLAALPDCRCPGGEGAGCVVEISGAHRHHPAAQQAGEAHETQL